MRKNKFITIIAISAITILCYSCGGTKAVPITKALNETKVSVPCENSHTDKDFFRGMGVGQSKDLNTARDKARMAANTELASSISTLIKRVAEKYVNDAGQVPSDYAETFEALTREVIQQQISNVSIACNETMRTSDNMYKVYMATEAKKEEVFATLERNAAANKKFETIFNREKFRKHFDEEMDAFAKTYGNN
ncbi:MAG: hypothetical protein LBT27_05730 [Prevotellaceae bacterium]|nr:hypothetical protein [Prevotellaceae bacterium]